MSEGEEVEAAAGQDDAALVEALASLMVIARELRELADQVMDLNNKPLEPPASSSAFARFDGGVS